MNLLIGDQNVTWEDRTHIYLILADVKRSLYDAKYWFPFVIISFVFGGRSGRPTGGGGLEVGFDANCRCVAVTDRYTGAILPLGTGLLTVFLNREVTVLPGLTFYFLLHGKSFGTEPRWPQWRGDWFSEVIINRGSTVLVIGLHRWLSYIIMYYVTTFIYLNKDESN